MTSIMKVNMAHQSEIMNNILARLAHSTTVNSRDLMKVSKRRRKNSKTLAKDEELEEEGKTYGGLM